MGCACPRRTWDNVDATETRDPQTRQHVPAECTRVTSSGVCTALVHGVADCLVVIVWFLLAAMNRGFASLGYPPASVQRGSLAYTSSPREPRYEQRAVAVEFDMFDQLQHEMAREQQSVAHLQQQLDEVRSEVFKRRHAPQQASQRAHRPHVEESADELVRRMNPDVGRQHGFQVELRVISISRAIVEYLFDQRVAQLRQQQRAAAAQAGSVTSSAATGLAAKAARLEAASAAHHAAAQQLVWDVKQAYAPWKSLGKAAYDFIKSTLQDVNFTEECALWILKYFVTDHPSEESYTIVFLCLLRLPESHGSHYRSQLLMEAMPFVVRAKFAEVAAVFVGQLVIAQMEVAKEAALPGAGSIDMLSPVGAPAQSSEDDEQ